MRTRAVVVDDESLVRNRIQRYLEFEPRIEVIAECRDGLEAVATIRKTAPDLVFLDIQMPGLNGFEVIDAVGAGKMPVTVFITAHDQFALKAFEAQALDYLLKPFGQERFHQAVQRAMTFLEGNQNAELKLSMTGLIDRLSARFPQPARLAVKANGRILFLGLDEISWIEAVGDYVNLHAGKETHLLRARMIELEKQLATRSFLRVHRSAIVNLNCVKEFRPFFDGKSVLILKDGTRLPVSRNTSQKVQALLAGVG